jgi:hypothetical protein
LHPLSESAVRVDEETVAPIVASKIVPATAAIFN